MAQQASLLSSTPGIGITRQLADCKSSYDILRLTREFARKYGFDFFTIGRFPRGKERTLSAVALVTNWPPEMTARYDACYLLERSPITQAMRKSIKPIVFSEVRDNKAHYDPAGEGYYELWEAYGVREGITVPVHHVSGQRGAVALFGARGPLSECEVMEITYNANLIYERLVDIVSGEEATLVQPLTQRERECLQWTACGKTSLETAMILGLSEHTVNHYLNAACQKLGAANRPHAVAKAIRSRMLD